MPNNNHRVNGVKAWRTVSLSTGISWLLKFLMIGLLPYELYLGQYLFAVATVSAIILSLVPSTLQRNYRMNLPFELDLLVTLSLFLHTFLGEGFDFYQKIWVWDIVLHAYGTAVVGLLGFITVYTLHYTGKLRLTIPLIGFFSFIFAMGVGGLWEIGEFAIDKTFNRHTQDGLDDTMYDMIADMIGGIVVAVLGMIYVRYSKPDARVRLAKPLGEVMGLGSRIDRIKRNLKRSVNANKNRGG